MPYINILLLEDIMSHDHKIYMIIPCIVCYLPADLMKKILYPAVSSARKGIHAFGPVSPVTARGR